MITQQDIEQPGTPAQLHKVVQQTRERVEADREEDEKARRKVGLYKVFVDEIEKSD
jgi:hypothetical protein